MKSSHRFPLRRQIVWGMRFFTFLTSLAVGAALFILSNQYVRANSLQAAEFNLRLVATSIETSLESADALLNWASIDSTVRRYISQENINGTQTIAAYEAMQEKYYSSTLYSHILRFFVTNENDRHLQFGPLNSSAALNRTSVKQFLTKGYGMQFATDPLLPGSPSCIAISQPVRCGKGTLHRGSTYLALDTAIITDPAMREWTFANDNGRNPQMKTAHFYVEHWEDMKAGNIGYLLWGSVGTGKSYLAGCIANALMEKEISVRMTNFALILNDLAATFEGKNEYISNLCRYPLLILDDFGMERGTEYGLEQVYNVIDSRYRSGKPLIVTTNLTLTELQNPQDTPHARIYDRLLEMCAPVCFSGENFRRESAQNKLNRLKQLMND